MLWLLPLYGRQSVSVDEAGDARKAEQSGNLPLAESLYEKLVAARPAADLYQRLGLVRHLQNKFAEAANAFSEAIRLNPRSWPSHLFLGIDDYRLSRFSEALTHLKTAARLEPTQQETQFWLGATYLALHQHFAGFSTLESVLEKDPKNVDALRLLAESYANYGTQLMNQIAEKYPDSAAGLEVTGRAFEFEGSFHAALDAYRKSEEAEPHRSGIREAITRVRNEIQNSPQEPR